MLDSTFGLYCWTVLKIIFMLSENSPVGLHFDLSSCESAMPEVKTRVPNVYHPHPAFWMSKSMSRTSITVKQPLQMLKCVSQMSTILNRLFRMSKHVYPTSTMDYKVCSFTWIQYVSNVSTRIEPLLDQHYKVVSHEFEVFWKFQICSNYLSTSTTK